MQVQVVLENIGLTFHFAQLKLSVFCLLIKDSEPFWVNVFMGETTECL